MKYYDGFGKDVSDEIAELKKRVETLELENMEFKRQRGGETKDVTTGTEQGQGVEVHPQQDRDGLNGARPTGQRRRPRRKEDGGQPAEELG